MSIKSFHIQHNVSDNVMETVHHNFILMWWLFMWVIEKCCNMTKEVSSQGKKDQQRVQCCTTFYGSHYMCYGDILLFQQLVQIEKGQWHTVLVFNTNHAKVTLKITSFLKWKRAYCYIVALALNIHLQLLIIILWTEVSRYTWFTFDGHWM